MLRNPFLGIISAAIMALSTPVLAQQQTVQQDGKTWKCPEPGRLLARQGGLGVSLGDYIACVTACKNLFPEPQSSALTECIKGCGSIKSTVGVIIPY